MSFFELLLIAVSMSMDAFAVSICKGLSVRKVTAKQCLAVGGWFGGFQGLMPMIGFVLTSLFASLICSISHWIAFALLLFIGGKMLVEGIRNKDSCAEKPAVGFTALLVQGVATAIDALSVGFTIADYDWLMALVCCLLIAVVTFFICVGGLVIGKKAGTCLAGKASILGGVILIAIGLEIWLQGIL